jgi:ketosteroid isomerase-like protein
MTSASAAAIRAQRERSNQAIDARDADLVVSFMLDDVTVAVAGGPVLAGRAASRAAFAEQFADRLFLGYVRTADHVVLHEPPVRATERGRWSGRWRRRGGDHELRGTYVAEWRHTDLGWLIASEAFTPADGTSGGSAR